MSQFSVLPGLQKSITLFEGPQASLLPRLLIVALNMKSMEQWLTNIDGKPAVLVKKLFPSPIAIFLTTNLSLTGPTAFPC